MFINNNNSEGWDEEKGIPNTMIFMAIAWMQLITLICSRRIQKDEFNIFSSIQFGLVL